MQPYFRGFARIMVSARGCKRSFLLTPICRPAIASDISPKALTNAQAMICRAKKKLIWGVACALACAPFASALAQQPQQDRDAVAQPAQRFTLEDDAQPRRSGPARAASILWQGVPLRDAVARLKPLFADTVFVDRRVNPNVPRSHFG
jgi:hypothetical protein